MYIDQSRIGNTWRIELKLFLYKRKLKLIQ